jgi:two-component system, chemotaxis family, sensor kinase CheA
MQGKETELDKTIIEAIKDPLTHLVRNAVDHGIEDPETRVQAGKSPEGYLLLRAFHEGGQVNIEISDDGAGLNLERILEKALTRGLISREDSARISEREIGHLIFMPGFSTAEKVSNVSGRGVGMDVVKTNIEKIGGTVDLQSQFGLGSSIKIKIPLTLAIIPALVVTSGGDQYAIPQVSLLELVRLEGEQATRGIERMHGAPVYRLRGQLLPLVYINQQLKLEAAETGVAEGADGSGVVNIVVLRADDRQFGLVVDSINDTEEIVVKPLSKQLKSVPVFAGATIMGDGKVALILDVLGIAQNAGVVSAVRDRALADINCQAAERSEQYQTLLLVGVGPSRRVALPLSQVARLEKIARADVEYAGNREVVQYRGQILPLVRLSQVIGGCEESEAQAEDEFLQVIVYSEEGRSVGLVVDRIIDIAQARLDVQLAGNNHGIVGSAVIQQHVTDLLNVNGLLEALDPQLAS